MKKLITLLFFFSSLCHAQTSGTKDTIICSDSIIKVCRTIQVPVFKPFVVQSQYINKFELWIAEPDKYLAWAKAEGTNSINCYARSFLKTSANRKKLAAFVKLAKEKYDIKEVFIDYRNANEIANWKAYFQEFPLAIYSINFITEIEPYITGDYAGYYSAIREADKFTAIYGNIIGVYMGHPSQAGWDSTIYHCDRVYLSKYISMSVYSAGKSYNYVKGRLEFVTISAKKFNKVDFPIVYIVSLEKKSWGAGNDFQGDLYITNSFYGSAMQKDFTDYRTKSSTDIKLYTELVGESMFTSEYNLKARPIK